MDRILLKWYYLCQVIDDFGFVFGSLTLLVLKLEGQLAFEKQCPTVLASMPGMCWINSRE